MPSAFSAPLILSETWEFGFEYSTLTATRHPAAPDQALFLSLLAATLHEHLTSITNRVIAEAIHGDQRDAEEQAGPEPARIADRK